MFGLAWLKEAIISTVQWASIVPSSIFTSLFYNNQVIFWDFEWRNFLYCYKTTNYSIFWIWIFCLHSWSCMVVMIISNSILWAGNLVVILSLTQYTRLPSTPNVDDTADNRFSVILNVTVLLNTCLCLYLDI